MSRRARIALSVALGVLSALLGLAYGESVRHDAERARADLLARYGGELVTLAVAREGLEPGDVASAANVELREWVSELAPAGAITDLDEIVGRELSSPVAQDAPLTNVNFRDPEQVAEVPAGHVALTVPLSDKLGVPGNVAVGSTLLAYRVGSESVELVASDMTVLASPALASGVVASGQLTLAVLPEDVAAVLAASASSDLRLVMPAKGLEGASGAASPAAPQALEPAASASALSAPAPGQADREEGTHGQEQTAPRSEAGASSSGSEALVPEQDAATDVE